MPLGAALLNGGCAWHQWFTLMHHVQERLYLHDRMYVKCDYTKNLVVQWVLKWEFPISLVAGVLQCCRFGPFVDPSIRSSTLYRVMA
jgi:hypothetical protein